MSVTRVRESNFGEKTDYKLQSALGFWHDYLLSGRFTSVLYGYIMIYFTDGFCLLANPSPKGGGYTVFNGRNKLIEHTVINKQGFTNNEAELLGIVAGLKKAKKHDTVVTDSQICLGWILRKMAGSRQDLNWVAKQGSDLMIQKQVYLAWQPREVNLAGHYNEQSAAADPPSLFKRD